MKKIIFKICILYIILNLIIANYCLSLSTKSEVSQSSEDLHFTNTSIGTQARFKKYEEKTVSKDQFKNYSKSKPVRFIENKGQIVDVNSRPVPFVLFKAETPGMNLYIT